jgi:O-antigen/teichoic acid export membrane protein
MSIKKNAVANFLGQSWVALMNIAFIPVYINYLGVEAYGLVGIFTMMQAWLGILDLGMTPTLNREMARYTAGLYSAKSVRNLIRSLEVVCSVLSLIIIIFVWLLAKWFADNWLQSEKISIEEITNSIVIMGYVVALRFAEGLYKSAILGLQKQVTLNIVISILATFRTLGCILVLALVNSSIVTFFAWQGFVSFLSIIVFSSITYKFLPKIVGKAKFSFTQLKLIKSFAGGMFATSITVLLLVQVDKLILSHSLSLEMFGYYTFASSIVAVLNLLTGPVLQAYYPNFTKLVSSGDIPKLTQIYHQSAQIVSVLIIPMTLILIFFGEKLLLYWTGNIYLVKNTLPILQILAIGTMCNCLMQLPYQLTLAYGWVSFGLYQNLFAVVLLVPAILIVTPKYGAQGAAWIWLILNFGYVFISIYFIHKRILPTEKRRWYLNDIVLPAIASILSAFLLLKIQPEIATEFLNIMWILISAAIIYFSALLSILFMNKIYNKYAV